MERKQARFQEILQCKFTSDLCTYQNWYTLYGTVRRPRSTTPLEFRSDLEKSGDEKEGVRKISDVKNRTANNFRSGAQRLPHSTHPERTDTLSCDSSQSDALHDDKMWATEGGRLNHCHYR